mgnify:CR=1 FL=1
MNEYGKVIGEGAVRFERLLPGPIERVWAYLTESEKRGKWLAKGGMELRVGGKVQLDFLHKNLTPHSEPIPERFKSMENGSGFAGTVTQCEPPRLLAYTWGGDTSEVKFELTPQGERVLLVLTHTHLRDRGEMTNVASGWHTHLGILEDNLSERTPRPFWSSFERVEADYKQRLAETNDSPSLQIVRRFVVSPETVFDTLTKPDDMRIWWNEGETIFDIDLRVGGRWTIINRRGGEEYTATGEYLEVERPRRLKYTFAMPQFSPNSDTIAVEIEPEGDGCVVTFVQSGEDIANELTATPPGAVSGSEAGWQQGFDLMAAAWANDYEVERGNG